MLGTSFMFLVPLKKKSSNPKKKRFMLSIKMKVHILGYFKHSTAYFVDVV